LQYFVVVVVVAVGRALGGRRNGGLMVERHAMRVDGWRAGVVVLDIP
jgi:hypothetical protein